MRREIPTKLKIAWGITATLFFLGFWALLAYPNDINEKGILKRQGIAEMVRCRDRKHAHSHKTIYISGQNFEEFSFSIQGECDALKANLQSTEVVAYGYKAPLNSKGFVTMQVESNGQVVLPSSETKGAATIAFVVMFIVTPLIAVGSMTFGFYTGRWDNA